MQKIPKHIEHIEDTIEALVAWLRGLKPPEFHAAIRKLTEGDVPRFRVPYKATLARIASMADEPGAIPTRLILGLAAACDLAIHASVRTIGFEDHFPTPVLNAVTRTSDKALRVGGVLKRGRRACEVRLRLTTDEMLGLIKMSRRWFFAKRKQNPTFDTVLGRSQSGSGHPTYDTEKVLRFLLSQILRPATH